jgi:hypothetical protein
MNPSRRIMLIAAIAAASLTAPLPALAQRRDPGVSGSPSGTITLSAKGAAVGVGYTWGDGTLHYGRRTYRFTVNGISVADVGFSTVRGNGRVYNLHRLQDFSGTYAAATGEATVVNGLSGQVLRNAAGVEIRLDNVTKGARLQGSADGIKLTLR